MKTFRWIASFFLLFFATIFSTVPSFAESSEVTALKDTLAQLNKQEHLSENDTRLKNAINIHLEFLSKYEQMSADFETASNDVKNADSEIKRINAEKERLEGIFAKEDGQDLLKLNHSQLSEEFSKYQNKLLDDQKKFEEYKIKSDKLQIFSEYSQEKNSTLQQGIDEAKQQLIQENLLPFETAAYAQKLKYYQHYVSYLQFLNISKRKLIELTDANLSLRKVIVDHDKEMLTKIDARLAEISKQEKAAEFKKFESESAQLQLSVDERSKISDFIAEQNDEYRKLIEEATSKSDIYEKESKTIALALEQASDIEYEVNSQIGNFSNSMFLAQALESLLRSIPEYDAPFNFEETLSAVRLDIYEQNIKFARLADPEGTAQRISQRGKTPLTKAQINAIAELLKIRRTLVSRYLEKLQTESQLLLSLKMNNDLYEQHKRSIQETVTKKLFWLQSNPKINKAWFKNLPNMLQKELTGTRAFVDASNFEGEVLKKLPRVLVLVLFSLCIVLSKKAITRQIKSCHNKVGSYRKDTHYNTPLAVFLTFLRSSNWACWSIIIGLLLSFMTIRVGIYNIGEIAKENNIRVAFIILLMCFANTAMKPGEIYDRHFNLPGYCSNRRMHVAILGCLALLSLGCTSKELYPHTIAIDVVGQILFFFAAIAAQVILFKTLKRSFKNPKATIVNKLLILAFNFIPIALMVMLWQGYYYSAIKVVVKCIDTYFAFFLAALVFLTILRSLSITSRRLAYARRKEEKERMRHEDLKTETLTEQEAALASSSVPVDDEEMMPTSEISHQTVNILNLAVFTGLAVVIYIIWSDVITAMSYLRQITLWTVSATDPTGKGAITVNISLSDVLIACYAFIMTFIVVKNLPGLLEIIVLNRFSVTKNASYSIKTILSYVVLASGITFGCSKLGVSWDNLKWLVTALSVGIGFGLQEIVANFISGIIILFERPIRPGDIITIGNTTGVVTKIRTRATTITDFDKRDLIVPNKTFITSQLSNWSLNDICLTRMCINVSAGYGSDQKLVHDTLMKIGEQNRYVAKNPKHFVVFTGFGESNLDFHLMVFIEKIQDYYPAIDSLNSAIYDEFNKLGIEIAFNQMDVFIKNTKTGNEIKVKSSEENSAAA